MFILLNKLSVDFYFYLIWNVTNMFSISDINKDKVDMVVTAVIACLAHNELAPT